MEKDASLPPDGRGGGIGANKRHLIIGPDPECAKKVSPPSASVQDTYVYWSRFKGIIIVYITMIKASISKLETVQRPGPSFHLLNFAQLLHKNSIEG